MVLGSDGAGGSGYYLARAGGDLDRSFGEAASGSASARADIIHPGGDDAPGASDGVLIDGGLVVVGAAQRDMWAARYLLGAR